MYMRFRIITLLVATLLSTAGFAQDSDAQREKEELQMIALEALMASPSERALPALMKLLEGNGSDELKENALFVLSQIDHPDASAKLLSLAHDGDGEIQLEAIQMIGINGEESAMAGLSEIYANGDDDVREAVLEAYMIADDTQAVFDIAMSTTDEEDYEAAVEMLAVMDAHEELAKLREAKGISDALIEAYIISDNDEELRILAMDSSNIELQVEAIEALGIVAVEDADTVLVDIYTSSDIEDIKEAALQGLLIGDFDEAVLGLYRSSNSMSEKGELLETLVIMDSDLAMDVIDAALAGDQ
jgi:HEAT repeat protein